MLNYYNLVAAQDRADRIETTGYRISSAAKREASRDAVAHHLNQQRRADQEEKQAVRRTAIATFASAIRAVLRGRAALAR